jgi:hypothetical protein
VKQLTGVNVLKKFGLIFILTICLLDTQTVLARPFSIDCSTLLGLLKSTISGSIIVRSFKTIPLRFQHTQYFGQDAVVLYRILSEVEFEKLNKTGKFELGPNSFEKSFSLFWRGSISHLFFTGKMLNGGTESYQYIVRVFVSSKLFEKTMKIVRGSFFPRLDIDYFHYQHSQGVTLKGEGMSFIMNTPAFAGSSELDVIKEAMTTNKKFDEIALDETGVQQLNRYLLGFELFDPVQFESF